VTKYETTFILEPGFDDGRLNEEIERVSQWIKDLGGELLEVQRWGKKRLAYEIEKKRDGNSSAVCGSTSPSCAC
jgi:small subunit ribosomal protein S6